jgi:hypothetical protein
MIKPFLGCFLIYGTFFHIWSHFNDKHLDPATQINSKYRTVRIHANPESQLFLNTYDTYVTYL